MACLPKHPEFEMQLRELIGSVDLSARISEPDIFQQVFEYEQPLEILKKRRILCDDPLLELSNSDCR